MGNLFSPFRIQKIDADGINPEQDFPFSPLPHPFFGEDDIFFQVEPALKERFLNMAGDINACLPELETLSTVKEITAQKRSRLYSYVTYTEIMNQGTDLPQ